MCQYWSTGRKKMIVICPASIRKQWSKELIDKFGIENEVLDTKNYSDYKRRNINPFGLKKVIICSYNFAAKIKDVIKIQGFDLAVIDEAHKLRNVYKSNAKTSSAIKDALKKTKKLLLTATPLQNSVSELFGLVSVIDDRIFGNHRFFKAQYGNSDNLFDLRQRLIPYCKRTLRQDVKEYIRYTNRQALTEEFSSTDLEFKLYEEVSDFLRLEDTYSVPKNQQMLVTMIARKILASSTYALIGTLSKMKFRLERMLKDKVSSPLSDEEDEITEVYDEYEDEQVSNDKLDKDEKIDELKLRNEIKTLERFIEIANKIKQDSKSKALLKALEKTFALLPQKGANRKALIFTESTRTQEYLKNYLEENGYKGKVVTFNGSNNDPKSNEIYERWLKNNNNTGNCSNIRAVDKRAAIIDCFRDEADIMIATEAASEGFNLQFCSLVINYDLPWNPQRVEQRIGRCHRYGQKSDVIVVNFVNKRNYIDQHVYELLQDKFQLFDGLFGASDDILGQVGANDFNFEKRIWEVCQKCRTKEEIDEAFAQIQVDLNEQITEKMNEVRRQILENFDINVQERLKIAQDKARRFLNRYELIFWELTKYIIGDKAVFDDKNHAFKLIKPIGNCPIGKYELPSRITDGIPYRLSYDLAQYVLDKASNLPSDESLVSFHENDLNINVTIPSHLRNKSGYLILKRLTINSSESEQYCLFTAFTKNGYFLSQEECEMLFLCGGKETEIQSISQDVKKKLNTNSDQHVKAKITEIDDRDKGYFKKEEDRLIRWERENVQAKEEELNEIRVKIDDCYKKRRLSENLEEIKAIDKKIYDLQNEKRKKREEIFKCEDELSSQRHKMLEELENSLMKTINTDTIFVVGWQTR